MIRTIRPAAGLVVAVLLAGCSADPSEVFPLPFRTGVGDDGFTVIVQMADAANLVPNAEAKVADVTVGTVTSIEFEDWTAKLVVSLEEGVVLPANAVARIGQKSLLGAEFVELAPPTAEQPTGRLADGDVIPLARTTRYPETEEVLAALSVVLNGGGLQHIRTITTELNAALSGREEDVRSLIDRLGTFVGSLEEQKGEIVRAIEGLNRLTENLVAQNDRLAHAIRTIPAGLDVLEQQRSQLVSSLDALSHLGDVATRVIESSGDDLVANLHDLRPVLSKLADAGHHLTQSLSLISTFPFPAHTAFPAVLKGDYGNLFITLDLDPASLARNFGVGFGSGPDGLPLIGPLPPLGAGVTGGDPLRLPLDLPPAPPAPSPVLPVPGVAPPSGSPGGAAEGTGEGLIGSLLGGGR